MNFMSRINWSQGFFRFFLVISVLWVALVGYNEIVDEDFTPKTIRESIYLETSSGSVTAPDVLISCWFDLLIDSREVEQHFRRYSYSVAFRPRVSISAEEVAKRHSENIKEMKQCLEERKALWTQEYQDDADNDFREALIFTFLPPIGLFVFFFVLSWVLRGFRKQQA